MTFHADLHVHSKYSRATSRDLDLERLAWWAARKGVAVVGTGDCVHPAWLAEIKDKLVPDGTGLFRLRDEIAAEVEKALPPACRQPVRFMLSTEISTIYKKGDKTRKIHHLIYAADFDAADRLAASLARIGNIASDGRPILGLDSRDLLEITLDSGPDSYLVPAHVWTPWFAALGSQSGFNSIAECYGDLADHIFAVETGLSSDPAMNRRVSFLDRYRLTSNSDAHSPGKLGREATRFSCAPDYFAIRRALETGEGYVGTVEFFPEEGKYHLDGHRACGVRLEPQETLAREGRCPVCGRPVTVGVAHRVEMLADRSAAEAQAMSLPTAGTVASFVPLPEILAEIIRSGAESKTVGAAYDRATARLGPELSVLGTVPIEDIARADPLLGEAVARLRAGAVIREAGYDGEYGVIRLFAEGELDSTMRGALLIDAPIVKPVRTPKPRAQKASRAGAPSPVPVASAYSGRADVLANLDADQAAAAAMVDGPLVVIAGPGSGKTRMLAHRIAHLVLDRSVPATACLAVTFTRRATEELKARLATLLGERAREVAVHSFHSLGLAILRAHGGFGELRIAGEAERQATLANALAIAPNRAARLLRAVSVLKRSGEAGEGDAAAALAALRQHGRAEGWVDFDDLVALAVALLERDAKVAAYWRSRFQHILADEFQDVDMQQYRLLRLLAGPGDGLCVIGDPNQAIYGFRGADATCFARFAHDFPTARTAWLARNYRSSGAIVAASAALVGAAASSITRPMQEPIVLHAAPNERAEAEFVAAAIEDLMGGHDLLASGSAKPGRAGGAAPLGFADFAVLYRTDAQSATLREAFDRTGIPFRKSTPARIIAHAGVAAILALLAQQREALAGSSLAERIAAAAEAARLRREADAAALAEARGWLAILAATPDIAGDEARLREQAALATEADFHDARGDRVSLLTMHAAKGLEFPVVFVIGLEDGLVPLAFGSDDARDDAEERRLLYVAMTRAKDRLFLTRAAERSWRGAVRTLAPSPFLAAIPPALTEQSMPPRRRSKPQQYSLF